MVSSSGEGEPKHSWTAANKFRCQAANSGESLGFSAKPIASVESCSNNTVNSAALRIPFVSGQWFKALALANEIVLRQQNLLLFVVSGIPDAVGTATVIT